jgi:hypothetical protein
MAIGQTRVIITGMPAGQHLPMSSRIDLALLGRRRVRVEVLLRSWSQLRQDVRRAAEQPPLHAALDEPIAGQVERGFRAGLGKVFWGERTERLGWSRGRCLSRRGAPVRRPDRAPRAPVPDIVAAAPNATSKAGMTRRIDLSLTSMGFPPSLTEVGPSP